MCFWVVEEQTTNLSWKPIKVMVQPPVNRCIAYLLCLLLVIEDSSCGHAFSPRIPPTRTLDASKLFLSQSLPSSHDEPRNDTQIPMDRSCFLGNARSAIIGIAASATTIIATASRCNAIEFVPASPYFTGTYSDAIDIMYAQRLAIDNIANIINDNGNNNMEEAGFKIMQLIAQTRTAGKIILDTFQENIAKGGDSVMLLRYLSCQKKFAILLDCCDECSVELQSALVKKGKLLSSSTSELNKNNVASVAQTIKTLNVVEETKGAYDDFLADVKIFEETLLVKK